MTTERDELAATGPTQTGQLLTTAHEQAATHLTEVQRLLDPDGASMIEAASLVLLSYPDVVATHSS